MTPQIGRAAARPVPARLLLQPLPRLVVTFAPGITRPIQIGRIGSRPIPVRLLLVGSHQLAPAQPAFDPIATILPDVGFAAVIIDN